MSSEAADLAVIRRFQSEVAAIREAEEPYAVRMTIHVLAAAILACIVVSLFARVDRIVSSTSGKIVATVKSSVVQALDDTSIIKSLDVREGDRVVKGQQLATIDPTFTGADTRQLEDQVASLNAQIARDEAELQGVAPKFVDDGSASAKKYIALQSELYRQRVAQYKAQIASFDQKVDQTLATIQKAEGDEERLTQRDKIAKQIDEMRGKLLQSGAGSLLNKLGAEDQRIEMLRTLENARNTANEGRHQLESLRADREAFVQNWSSQLSQDAVTARNNLGSASAQLEKAKKHSDSVKFYAPEDAVVLQMTKLSVGSIMRASDQVMTLAPLSAPVEAEVSITPRDVGFLRVGDETTIKVDAFNYTEHGVATGKVKWISEGAFTMDEDTGQPAKEPYYRARITIDRLDFIRVPDNFRLIPGMTLTGEIKVGRRTIASYIWESIARGSGGAMREP